MSAQFDRRNNNSTKERFFTFITVVLCAWRPKVKKKAVGYAQELQNVSHRRH